MIKEYILFSSFAISLLIFVVISIATQDNSILKSQKEFTKLTTIIEPSLSTSILENRFLFLREDINRVYPLMPKLSKKGFVYAK